MLQLSWLIDDLRDKCGIISKYSRLHDVKSKDVSNILQRSKCQPWLHPIQTIPSITEAICCEESVTVDLIRSVGETNRKSLLKVFWYFGIRFPELSTAQISNCKARQDYDRCNLHFHSWTRLTGNVVRLDSVLIDVKYWYDKIWCMWRQVANRIRILYLHGSESRFLGSILEVKNTKMSLLPSNIFLPSVLDSIFAAGIYCVLCTVGTFCM